MIRDAFTIAIAPRSLSPVNPTVERAPVPAVGLPLRTAANGMCAITGTVELAAVAGPTYDDLYAATVTEKGGG